MIDYRNLHSKIKAALKPDSHMPEGYVLRSIIKEFPECGLEAVPDGYSEFSSSLRPIQFGNDFYFNGAGSIEWFAEALGIPLEDNGYTDLVKAAEREIEINTAFRAGLSAEEMEEWESYSNDVEIALGAALQRIKSENQ